MSNKLKIILFFVIILIAAVGLWVVFRSSGGGSLKASPVTLKNVSQDQINLKISDKKDIVAQGSALNFELLVSNNTDKTLGPLRVYGYIGLPTPESTIIQNTIPSWIIPVTFRKYPAANYFNYLFYLRPHSKAKAQLPVGAKKYFSTQDKVYSRAYLQLVNSGSKWNILNLKAGVSGKIIAVSEDVDTLN